MKLGVFLLLTGDEIFSAPLPDFPANNFSLFEPLSIGSAFSEPIGYIRGPIGDLVGKNSKPFGILFSPDSRYIIATGMAGEAVAVDLRAREKMAISGSVRKRLADAPQFVSPNRIAAMDPQRPDQSVLLSFPGGDAVEQLGVAGSARSASSARYLLYSPLNGAKEEVLDLETRKTVSELPGTVADVFGEDVVTYVKDGDAVLSKLGDPKSAVKIHLSAGELAVLRTAVVSRDLSALAVGVTGEGGVFRTATGKRVADFGGVNGAWFDGGQSCYMRLARSADTPLEIKTLNLASGQIADGWSSPKPRGQKDLPSPGKEEFFLSGPALLGYAMKFRGAFVFGTLDLRVPNPVIPSYMAGGVSGFHLRALETRSGTELWSREFGSDPPVPFTDPQGDRVVLGWPAKSAGAREAVKHNPSASARMKHAKLSAHDSFFEVLDARTGKSIGGVLVQMGAGAASFDSAFSEGDWLVLAKDGQRVLVISLSTGEDKLTLFGSNPSLSADGSLLSIVAGRNLLSLYDLKTGAKRQDYSFPEMIACAYFSLDAKRLLVLTEDQSMYVLDANGTALSGTASPASGR